jgi:CRP-like cAMP-binding protein
LLRRVARRLERVEQELAWAALPEIRERLLYVLRELATTDAAAASDGASVIPPNWSHMAIARRVGVCRETVTRGLASLEEDGLIRRHGRRILVLAPRVSDTEQSHPGCNHRARRRL